MCNNMESVSFMASSKSILLALQHFSMKQMLFNNVFGALFTVFTIFMDV